VSRGKAGLDFFGAIAASVTHELNNSFSIIDQAQGLLADLAAASGSGQPVDPGRLKTVQERINRHVRKGVEIVGRFNRFAHSLDDPAGSFDLCGETGNIVALCKRFADLRYIRLECALHEDEVAITGDAFLLQHAIFICIQLLLDGSGEGDRLEVAVRLRDDAPLIAIAGTATQEISENDARLIRLAMLMHDLNGAYSIGPGDLGGTALTLRIRTGDGGSE
jgi:hypothetical protein